MEIFLAVGLMAGLISFEAGPVVAVTMPDTVPCAVPCAVPVAVTRVPVGVLVTVPVLVSEGNCNTAGKGGVATGREISIPPAITKMMSNIIAVAITQPPRVGPSTGIFSSVGWNPVLTYLTSRLAISLSRFRS